MLSHTLLIFSYFKYSTNISYHWRRKSFPIMFEVLDTFKDISAYSSFITCKYTRYYIFTRSVTDSTINYPNNNVPKLSIDYLSSHLLCSYVSIPMQLSSPKPPSILFRTKSIICLLDLLLVFLF